MKVNKVENYEVTAVVIKSKSKYLIKIIPKFVAPSKACILSIYGFVKCYIVNGMIAWKSV